MISTGARRYCCDKNTATQKSAGGVRQKKRHAVSEGEGMASAASRVTCAEKSAADTAAVETESPGPSPALTASLSGLTSDEVAARADGVGGETSSSSSPHQGLLGPAVGESKKSRKEKVGRGGWRGWMRAGKIVLGWCRRNPERSLKVELGRRWRLWAFCLRLEVYRTGPVSLEIYLLVQFFSKNLKISHPPRRSCYLLLARCICFVRQ